MKFKGELNVDVIVEEGKIHNQVDVEKWSG